MNSLKQIFRRNLLFIIPFLLFVIIGLVIISLYEKADIHIYINSYHNPFFDVFFKYCTYLGDGIFVAMISVALLFVKYKWALISGVSATLTAIIVQLLKRQVFFENYRPTYFFKYFYEGSYNLYIIEGAEPAIKYSFPSGHSASAFALFFFLAIIVKNNLLKFSLFIIALFIAFSRVYLSWHFLEDIIAGSLIGLIITMFSYLLLNKNNWLENSILNNNKH